MLADLPDLVFSCYSVSCILEYLLAALTQQTGVRHSSQVIPRGDLCPSTVTMQLAMAEHQQRKTLAVKIHEMV